LSDVREIPLSREITLLNNYLALEKMRFDDKLHYHFKVDDRLSKETCYVPVMLLQPIIENAVNHGVFHKEGEGQVWVEFEYKADKEYCVTISDDGIGVENSKALKAKSIRGHKSKATEVFAERVRLLNKTRRWTIKFTVGNLSEDKDNPGTVVKLNIKENDTSDIN
jgi:two-component system LytT family sensor kinase